MSVNPIQNLVNITVQHTQPGGKLPQQWQLGQTMNATVIGQPQAGVVTLNVGGTILQAHTSAMLKVGQTIKVEVANQQQQLSLKMPDTSNPTSQRLTHFVQQLTPNQQQATPFLANLVSLLKGKIDKQQSAQHIDDTVKNLSQKDSHQIGKAKPVQGTENQTKQPPKQTAGDSKQATQTPLDSLKNSNIPAIKNVLPKTVIEAMKKLMESLPKPEQLTNKNSLKQVIKQSGVMLEKNILDLKDNPKQLAKMLSKDFKANIFRLLSALETAKPNSTTTRPSTTSHTHPTTHHTTAQQQQQGIQAYKTAAGGSPLKAVGIPLRGALAPMQVTPEMMQQLPNNPDKMQVEIIRQTLATLARSQLSQIASVKAEPTQATSLNIEIPVFNGHGISLFQLLIEEEEKHGGEEDEEDPKEKTWTVTISFDLEHLGPMHVKLAVCENSVAAEWHVKDKKAFNKVQEDIDVLNAMLEEEGLHVAQMDIELEPKKPPPKPLSLLDIEA